MFIDFHRLLLIFIDFDGVLDQRARTSTARSSVLSPSREDAQRAQLQHMYFTQRAQHIQANAKLLETLIEIAHQKDVRDRFRRWSAMVVRRRQLDDAVRYNLERKASRTERATWLSWTEFTAASKWTRVRLERATRRRARHLLGFSKRFEQRYNKIRAECKSPSISYETTEQKR